MATPALSLVSNSGVWHEYDWNTGLTAKTVRGNWDWDGHPEMWWRGWVVIDASSLGITTWTIGDGTKFDGSRVLGSTADPGLVRAVQRIVQKWKPENVHVVRIIAMLQPGVFSSAFAAASAAPGPWTGPEYNFLLGQASPGTGNPRGEYGDLASWNPGATYWPGGGVDLPDYAGDPSSFPETIPIPNDNELASEASIAPAFRKGADRSAFLYERRPQVYSFAFSSPPAVTGEPGTMWTYGNTWLLENTVDAGVYLDVPDCKVGDRIHVTCFGSYTNIDSLAPSDTGASNVSYAMYLDAIDEGQAEAHVPGAIRSVTANDPANAYMHNVPFTLSGVWTVTADGTTRIAFAFQASPWAVTRTFTVHAAFSMTALRLPS